jgi:hypothetical protein
MEVGRFIQYRRRGSPGPSVTNGSAPAAHGRTGYHTLEPEDSPGRRAGASRLLAFLTAGDLNRARRLLEFGAKEIRS